jgi:hypothetical protein
MDEARAENAKRERELGLMEEISDNLEGILEDGTISDEELQQLKRELLRMRGRDRD